MGDDATFARASQDTKQKTLVAQVAAEDAGAKIVETPGRIDLKKKAKAYVSRQEDRGKAESVLTFNTAIDSFMNSAGARFADELTEQNITRWYGALRKQGNLLCTLRQAPIRVRLPPVARHRHEEAGGEEDEHSRRRSSKYTAGTS